MPCADLFGVLWIQGPYTNAQNAATAAYRAAEAAQSAANAAARYAAMVPLPHIPKSADVTPPQSLASPRPLPDCALLTEQAVASGSDYSKPKRESQRRCDAELMPPVQKDEMDTETLTPQQPKAAEEEVAQPDPPADAATLGQDDSTGQYAVKSQQELQKQYDAARGTPEKKGREGCLVPLEQAAHQNAASELCILSHAPSSGPQAGSMEYKVRTEKELQKQYDAALGAPESKDKSASAPSAPPVPHPSRHPPAAEEPMMGASSIQGLAVDQIDMQAIPNGASVRPDFQ